MINSKETESLNALQDLINKKVVLVHGRLGTGKSLFGAGLVSDFIRTMKAAHVVIADLYKGAAEYRNIQGNVKFLTGRELREESVDPSSVFEIMIRDIEQRQSKTCTLYVIEEAHVFRSNVKAEKSLRLLVELVRQTNSCLLLVSQRTETVFSDLNIVQHDRNIESYFKTSGINGDPCGNQQVGRLSDKQKLYYLQDARDFVGNSLLWWANNDSGYTCDIRCARIWTMEELNERFSLADVPLSSKYKIHEKDHVDRLIQHHIDAQDIGGDGPHTLRHWGKHISDPEFSKDVQIERLRRALDHSNKMYSLHINTTTGNHIPMVAKLKRECESIISGVSIGDLPKEEKEVG